MNALLRRGWLIIAVALWAGSATSATASDAFQQAREVLESRCLKCHGQDMRMAKLDLRSKSSALQGGEHGSVLTPGSAEKSAIYRRIAGLEKPSMPMDGKLSAAEIEILKNWIDQGAPWDTELVAKGSENELKAMEEMEISPKALAFWSFQPVKRPALPEVAEAEWTKNPIDRFTLRRLQQKELKPAPVSDRRTLVRRAYFDLLGVPPTAAQVKEFLADQSADAWPKLIDKLLASPHYGERWGRHWLDVARYADSNGYEHDFDRPNAWRYRDYVIRALNEDKPYDQFLREQIAGDELENVTHDSLIATGFLRNYAKVDFREKANPQFRYEYLDDMIATVGRGLLGMTVQCARCHNHKFDPIPQKDYYALQAALFNYVEVDHPLVPEEEAKEYFAKLKVIEEQIEPLKQKIEDLEEPYRKVLVEKRYEEFPPNIVEAIRTPDEKRTPGQKLLAEQVIASVNVSSKDVAKTMPEAERAQVSALEARIAKLEKQKPEPIPMAMGITDGDFRYSPLGPGDAFIPGNGTVRPQEGGMYVSDGSAPFTPLPSYFLHNGDIHSKGSLMKPGFLTVATPKGIPVELQPSHKRTSGRRLALAEWLVSPENPLTPRVIVNRIWHHHFGRGIVGSLDNFGQLGDRPTHPELLDWLAAEFLDKGWSIKHMHRLMMNSRTYQMSSSWYDPANAAKDANNLFLWRYRPQRLEAESLRDTILAVAGSLNDTMFGEPVFPPLPEELRNTSKHGRWEDQQEGPDVWRRSIYVYRKRIMPFPFFEVFDLPDQNTSCGRRNVSTVPTQALVLMNNAFVTAQSAQLADQIASMAPDNPVKQVEAAYTLALSRLPSEEEREVTLEFLKDNSVRDLAHVMMNLSEFLYRR